jgi:hypothetical protein
MSRTWFVTGATGSGSTLPTVFRISCTGVGVGDTGREPPPAPGAPPPPLGDLAGGVTRRTGAGEEPGPWPLPGVVGAPGAPPPAGPLAVPGAPAAAVAAGVLGTAFVTATFLDAFADVPVVPVSGSVGPEKACPTEPSPPTPPPSATAAATARTPSGAASERPVAPAMRRSQVRTKSMEPW